MYYSITFETMDGHIKKNTWDDWGLIPMSRPVINPPAVKTKTLDVPGRDGTIDLSSALTGYLNYENRTGNFEFYVDFNKAGRRWEELYSELLNYLNGSYVFIYLEDDPLWYYRGTAIVDQWKSNNDSTGSRVVITYNLEPYKLFYKSTDVGNTEFDILDMNSGPIFERMFKFSLPTDYNYTNSATNKKALVLDSKEIYGSRAPWNAFQHEQKPQTVELIVSEMSGGTYDMNVEFWRSTAHVTKFVFPNNPVVNKIYLNGTHVFQNIILGPYSRFRFQMLKANGTPDDTASCKLTVKFTPGRL